MPGLETLVGSALTEIVVEPVVPVVGVTESHPLVLDAAAVNETAVLVEVVTARFCVAGMAELIEVKVNEEGVATKLNEAAVTIKVTGSVFVPFESAA